MINSYIEVIFKIKNIKIRFLWILFFLLRAVLFYSDQWSEIIFFIWNDW